MFAVVLLHVLVRLCLRMQHRGLQILYNDIHHPTSLHVRPSILYACVLSLKVSASPQLNPKILVPHNPTRGPNNSESGAPCVQVPLLYACCMKAIFVSIYLYREAVK